MKTLLAIFIILSKLYCPQWFFPFGDRPETRVYNIISKYQPALADRMTAVYIDVACRYSIPIDYLVRQGWSETRFNRMRVGDNGQSYGIHQIKYKYWSHVLYKIQDDYVKKELSNNTKVNYKKLFQYVGGGIESAGYILSNYHAIYGDWETTFIAYGCGQSHRSTQICKTNKNHAYEYKFVRCILKGEMDE